MYRRNTKGWFKHLDFMIWDLICLQIAFFVSYWMRFGLINPYLSDDYRNMGILVEAFDLVVLLGYGTLNGVLRRGYYRELAVTVKHALLLTAVCVFYVYAAHVGGNYSRIAMFLMLLIYAALTYLVRILWKAYLLHRPREDADRTVVIFTTRDQAAQAVRSLEEHEHSWIRIAGLVIVDEDLTGSVIAGVPVVSNRDDAPAYVCREWVDEIFLLYPNAADVPRERIRQLSESGVIVHICIDTIMEDFGQQQIVETFGGYSVLTSTLNSMTHRQAFMKRAMDIAGGLVGCLITLVLFVILAPLIYHASPGPVFFRQERIGRNGKKFTMYKFRSMYPDAEARKTQYLELNRVSDGMMFKLDFDPRVIGNEILPDGTKKRGIGDFMRRYSLDEFPQFFNVLKGDMSLVGTRPPTVDEWEKYELHHRARLAAKPGITGMWQVSGRSDIQDFEEVVRLDVKYINEWSIGLDVKILLKTVLQVFKGDGAM